MPKATTRRIGYRGAVAASRRRLPIVVKLLVFFTLPTMLLFVGFAVMAHEVARRNLEAELGTRLAAIAASAATQIRGKYLVDLEPGGEGEPLYAGAVRKLEEVKEATGVARLYVFDREFRSRADTADGVGIGATYYQAELDRAPLETVFAEGRAVSSVLFEGSDGVSYKAGYAPVYADPDDDRRVVLALGADAPATFFARLSALRRSLLASGAALMVLVIGVAVLVAARISRPVRQLARAAERIGGGDLSSAIEPSSRDEIGLLAETMEEMRAELAARDERMQRMLSGIAHEVRNPLGGIQLFAGILRDEIPAGDERRPHVERIEREVGYLEAVVESFLDYARRPEPALEPLPVDELIADLCELEIGEAAARQVELTWEAPPLVALADRGQLRRALLNLIRNAVQAAAAEPPGTARVTAADRGAEVEIAVANSGAPIAAEIRDRLFEPFFTTREKGTGLGLAFVREIVADHGSRVELDSGDGRPTRFAFRLHRG
jgi:signal transduction histidine kinase